MVIIKLISKRDKLEQKIWIDSFDNLWTPNTRNSNAYIVLNTKDPCLRGKYKIEKIEMVINQKNSQDLPPYLDEGIAAEMDINVYLKRKTR